MKKYKVNIYALYSRKALISLVKMTYALEVSIQNADWLNLKSSDRVSVELARYYCLQIDLAEENLEQDPLNPDFLEHARKVYATVGKNLQATLTSLGLNPDARGELSKTDDKPKVAVFDELKAKRKRKPATG